MPTYDYQCSECKNIQEEFHKMSETPDIVCEKCGKPMKRIIACGGDYIMSKGGTRGSVQKFKKTSITPTPTEAAAVRSDAIRRDKENDKNQQKDPYYQFRDKK